MTIYNEIGNYPECDIFNVIGTHKFIESGTIRKCNFVEIGIALFEEEYHYGDGL